MIIILIFIVSLILFICGSVCKSIKETLIFWMMALPLGIWFWLFMYSEGIIDHTELVKPVMVGDVKVISFRKDGVTELINLNSQFSQQISDDLVAKVTFYKTGPYYGLYSAITPTKIELVPSAQKEEVNDVDL